MRCRLRPALAWAGWRRERARCLPVRTIGFTKVFACPLCEIQVERKGAPRRRLARRRRGWLQMLILPRSSNVFIRCLDCLCVASRQAGTLQMRQGFPLFPRHRRDAQKLSWRKDKLCVVILPQ